MSHYDSLNQLSSLVWIFLVSHLEYLMSLIALTLAFSLSDVTQRTSRFSFDNAYVIMSLLWLARWNLGSHVESNEVSGVQGTKAGERRLGQIRLYLISYPILEHQRLAKVPLILKLDLAVPGNTLQLNNPTLIRSLLSVLGWCLVHHYHCSIPEKHTFQENRFWTEPRIQMKFLLMNTRWSLGVGDEAVCLD